MNGDSAHSASLPDAVRIEEGDHFDPGHRRIFSEHITVEHGPENGDSPNARFPQGRAEWVPGEAAICPCMERTQ